MRLLLDTHALLWMLEDSPRLPRHVAAALGDPGNEKVISAVSAYEICLKHALGKLPDAAALATAFEAEIGAIDCTPLSITLGHAEAAAKLDLRHRDPFDRLLIAQARVERLVLVSSDALFDAYDVERMW